MTILARVKPTWPIVVQGTGGITVSQSKGRAVIGFDYETSELGAELQQAVDTTTANAVLTAADRVQTGLDAAAADASAAAAASSAADAAAAVENVQTAADPQQFAEGDDLSVDCKATFDRMVTAGLTYWKGRPGAVYRYVGQFTVPTAGIDFDLNGATFRPEPSGTDSAFATANYASSAAFGVQAVNVPAEADYPIDRFTVSTSPPSADFVVGRDIWFVGAGGSPGGIQPPCFRKIAAIDGDDIVLDQEINHPFLATSINAWVVKSWIPFFRVRNGTIDCSLMTDASTLGVMNLEGVDQIDVSGNIFANIDFNTSPVGSGNTIIRALRCGDVAVDNNRYPDSTRYGCYAQSQYCRSVVYTRNQASGEGFGFQINMTDNATFMGNRLEGRFRTQGSTGSSIRGIKATGINSPVIVGNTIRDYDSGMKIEDCGHAVITGNNLDFVGTGINLSNQHTSADALWSGHVVTGNSIQDAQADGIAVYSAGALDIKVNDNVIVNCGKAGIRYNAATGTCSGNTIHNWATDGTNNYPIYQANASFQGIVSDNTCFADDPTGLSGIYINSSGCMFGRNLCNTDNPYAKRGVPDLVSGVDLGQGMLVKIVAATGISDSAFTTVTFDTPFPNGFLGCVAISSASTPAAFSFQSGTKTSVGVKATEASSSVSLLVLGY